MDYVASNSLMHEILSHNISGCLINNKFFKIKLNNNFSVIFLFTGRVIVCGCNILDLIPEMTEWVMCFAGPLAESVKRYFDVTVFSSDDYHTHPEEAGCHRTDCFFTSNELISAAAAGESSVHYYD